MNKFLKVIIPVIIIIAGFAVMKVLYLSRSEPKKEVRADPGILVKTFEVVMQDRIISVKGTGTVNPSQKVSVIPQVSGRVTDVSPDLAVGGHFKKDTVLFEIEDIDYLLALEQAKAARANAEFELAKMESSASIARTEWERLKVENGEEPNPLVLYGPQLANARAALSSSIAAVEQAKLDLDRTKIKAPFNARVKSENIDIGQYVKSGSSVAVLTGTDTVEINVPMPAKDLQWLNIPIQGEKLNGPEATVSIDVGGQSYKWHGRILRTTGEMDPKSRMMNVVVEVRDPYGLKSQDNSGRPALVIGAFVNITIKGKKLKNIFEIPRTAFRDNSTVWIMNDQGMLQIKEVKAVRIERDKAIISEGIIDGEMIVLTNISGAADGMKLRQLK
jgi:RND family efflux transporter MFP subunit